MLHILTEQELSDLKQTLLNMYIDIQQVCQKYGISIILGGGSALGAMRHNGFIPWDDDMDAMMSRNDYERFKTLCAQGVFGDKYEFTYPNKCNDSKNLFMKIYQKGSECIEISDVGTPFPKGIFIDIFPIDNVPANRLLCVMKGFVSNLMSYISVSVLYYQYRNSMFKRYCESVGCGKVYKLRLFIGWLGSFMNHKTWAYLFDRFVTTSSDNGRVTIPTGRKLYLGEIVDREVMFPARKVLFEGVEVFVPNKVEQYLSNLYGDYMVVPPPHKRERHSVVSLIFKR